MATGTLTITDTGGAGKVRKITAVCVSDASGVVTSDAIVGISGLLMDVETIPSAADVPTAYNLQIRRASATGLDMLDGNGASRSATVRERCQPEDDNGSARFAPFRDDDLYITADTVGNAKSFTVIIYVLQEA